jgi:hypothetical protein
MFNNDLSSTVSFGFVDDKKLKWITHVQEVIREGAAQFEALSRGGELHLRPQLQQVPSPLHRSGSANDDVWV